MSGAHWPAERVEELRRLAATGLTSTAIGKAMNIGPETIRAKMQREGIALPPHPSSSWTPERLDALRRLADGTRNAGAIASAMTMEGHDIAAYTVAARADVEGLPVPKRGFNAPRFPWDAAADDALRRMAATESARAIAETLGCRPGTVERRAEKLGVKLAVPTYGKRAAKGTGANQQSTQSHAFAAARFTLPCYFRPADPDEGPPPPQFRETYISIAEAWARETKRAGYLFDARASGIFWHHLRHAGERCHVRADFLFEHYLDALDTLRQGGDLGDEATEDSAAA